jgi:AcrR family transcriptional regulator
VVENLITEGHGMDAISRGETDEALAFHPPKQTRSRRTMDRIASAALELVEEVGVEGTTVAAIVHRAQASVGSFYARFPGKDELIRHLQERVWAEATERWDEALAAQAWGGLPLARVVEGIVGLLLRSIEADYGRRKVLGRELRSDLQGAARAHAFHEHLLDTVMPLFLGRRSEISHPDPETAVRFGYRVVVGAIREFIELGENPGARPDDLGGASILPALGPELAHLWTGYLCPGSGAGERVEGGVVDFFDPWG